MPSCHTLQTTQQKSLLSLSAVVSATNAAEVVQVWNYCSAVCYDFCISLVVCVISHD